MMTAPTIGPLMTNTATQMVMRIHYHHPPTVTTTQHHQCWQWASTTPQWHDTTTMTPQPQPWHHNHIQHDHNNIQPQHDGHTTTTWTCNHNMMTQHNKDTTTKTGQTHDHNTTMQQWCKARKTLQWWGCDHMMTTTQWGENLCLYSFLLGIDYML